MRSGPALYYFQRSQKTSLTICQIRPNWLIQLEIIKSIFKKDIFKSLSRKRNNICNNDKWDFHFTIFQGTKTPRPVGISQHQLKNQRLAPKTGNYLKFLKVVYRIWKINHKTFVIVRNRSSILPYWKVPKGTTCNGAHRQELKITTLVSLLKSIKNLWKIVSVMLLELKLLLIIFSNNWNTSQYLSLPKHAHHKSPTTNYHHK